MPFYSKAKSRRFSPAAVPIVLLAGVVLAFIIGLLLGRQQGIRSVVPAGEARVENVDSTSDLSKSLDFKTFWDIWNFTKENYYKQPVSDEALFYGSIKGMLAGLEDPYSVFFDPDEAKEFGNSLNGTFEGIGAQIDVDENGQLVIVAPLPGSPAETVGLRPGDHILAIDGVETTGMSVDEAVTKIRGPKDSVVTLIISRDGLTEAMEIPITRNTITVDSVKLEMRDDGLAVISIHFFNEDTAVLFTAAMNDLLAQGAEGIILDLRSNPGGLLDVAIDIGSAWIGQDTVVIQSTRDQKQAFVGSSNARLSEIPTVVLVDGGSASASEIVAGALQDYGFAQLVGTQTFGKGSVQDYRELEDGSALKLTTAEWLTPKERSINHVGITPDFIVEYTLADAEAKLDPQMDKAVGLLTAASGH
ncbi:MAG: S41 family peptidase [Patescibacteria group bacterium]|jgi:carboxyl-terminal processing protease